MRQVVDFLAEMDPFAWEPSSASRIGGIGGGQPCAEGAYAFRTAQLVAPAGLVTITIEFAGLRASRGTLLVEVAGVSGAERRQVALRTLSLAALAAAGGTERITFASDRRDTYTVTGHVHDDTDGMAEGMTVRLAVRDPDQVAAGATDGVADEPGGAEAMARVSRLASVDPPSFAHLTSQTMTKGQLKESAFRAACRDLQLSVDAPSWPAAFLYQALHTRLGSFADLHGLGIGPSAQLLASRLTAAGAQIAWSESLNPAEWPLGGDLDLAWLHVEGGPEPALFLFVKACCLIERLRVGGVLAMVFPVEQGRMPHEACEVPKRGDVEIIALKMLAGGHSVAQLKFRAAEGAQRAGTRSPFGMIVHRMQ